MLNRRDFLRLGGGVGTAALVHAPFKTIAQVAAASAAVADRTPEDVAADEFYWREIQEAFTLDRTLTNLNNGNSCPSPRVVHEAVKRYMDMANMLPVQYNNAIGRNIGTVRRRLAAEFGCEPSELALTRNASESMQIAQNGIDMKPGDEVLTTEQDYPRMLTTWDQRVRRDKIKVTRIQFPVPTTQDDLYQRFEQAITPQTKVLHFCHITNLTGQLFPVQRLSRLARSRGILTMVDGAHALAHFPFKLRDLECDYYGVSLHKWLLAPLGNGLLYVRPENIGKTWPLQAVPDRQVNDITKFEAIGTHPEALRAAVAEALAFHQAIGAERKAARLRYLTLRWAHKVKAHPKVKLLSSLDAGQTWGVAMVSIDGIEPRALSAHMMDKYRIVVNAVVGGTPPAQTFDYSGLRVTPNVYTTLEEIDTFADAMLDVAKNGLPPAPAGRGGRGGA
jgi:selenocysteine lyase/cysteine desulfurase